MTQSQKITHNFKSNCNSQVYLIYNYKRHLWLSYAFYFKGYGGNGLKICPAEVTP